MVEGTMNQNVSPILNKPEQAAPVLADHTTSAMHKLDFLSCKK